MSIDYRRLREIWKKYWEDRNHKEVPPIPLVPKDDPTTLFTGSGMQQLVPYLLGQEHPLGKRLYNIQPSFRASDIEEVGDNRHDTFFEMMGNWSLGDYFKKEQLEWYWKFLTEELKLPKEKLYVTVFEGYKDLPAGRQGLPADEESYQIWRKLGIADDHIVKYGPEKNWWSRAGVPDLMPAGEPGGPDSEVFYEFTEIKHNKKFGEVCHPNCDCGRFLEIGNSVFIEYQKQKDGSFKELPKKNVDFGGGIERLLAAINDDPDMFKTDLYTPIIQILEEETNKKYEDDKASMQVIADHLKTSVFLISESLLPSNKEQGYILRRLIRRCVVKYHNLTDSMTPDFDEVINGILSIYDGINHIDKARLKQIIPKVVNEEVEKFADTLDKGLKIVNKLEKIDGKTAFDLYQSYGFPLEIVEELALEKGQQIDREEFKKEFEQHKELSRKQSAGKFKGGLADTSEQSIKYHTATHLLHQALFDVLGDEVRQEGSNITGERLRFDFSANRKLTDEELKKVEQIINDKIHESHKVHFEIMSKDKAQEIGAKSFFKEKYGDKVKVYFVGDYSKEFCGGPHVENTSQIEKIEIYKYEKIGSNLYRIYAK